MAFVDEIASGLTLPEALRADGDSLYFSDAVAGGVYRWTDAGLETVVPKRRGVGGLGLHEAGGIVISGRDLVHVRDGETRLLFRAEGALGLNDLLADADGSVLIGSLRMNWAEPEAGRPGELWRVGPGAEAVAVLEAIDYPNGVGLSPDGRTVYVADYVGARIHAADLEDGHFTNHRVLAALERGNADGLAIDAEGRAWVATGPGGSFDCFDAAGRLVDRIEPPASFAVTLCFGGADGRDLYMATADNRAHPHLGGTIFHTHSDTPGLPVARARV
jgi:sugar lactone lactonase YvrE